MKTTVNVYDFARAFETAGRTNEFSYVAKKALFDYLEELEEDCGQEMELDVVALCCDWAEYKTAVDAVKEMGSPNNQPDKDMSEDEREEAALEYLRDNTQVVEFDGGVLVASF